MVTLPTIKNIPKVLNPRFLILFGKPKTGKTTLLSTLENCLIVDLEGGSEFLEAMAIQARSVADLGEIANAIKAKITETGEKPYKYIAIDNATRLEDMCLPYAASLYRMNPIAKNWTGTDVRTLDKGAGYLYLREAVKTVIDNFRNLTDHFILIGHTKDSLITKDGQELSEMQIDLVGKLGDIVCGEADAVGYVYRKTNETIISFEGGVNSVREARAPHLRGQKIVIADSDKDNVISTYWDKIYLPTND
jgi:hypothetical protein